MVIDTMPAYVDRIVIVDDASKDRTVEAVKRYLAANEKVVLIEHQTNQGVGGAIVSGYKWARDNQYDVTVVMAGDGQMDPDDLSRILDPVASGVGLFQRQPAVLRGCMAHDTPLPLYR